MLDKFGAKAKLLFTDADSLTYEIETKGVYKDVWKVKIDLTSDYPVDSKFYDKTNTKVIGKFKDEAAGEIITVIAVFVRLRSKTYP